MSPVNVAKKRRKHALLQFLKKTGVFSLARERSARNLRILCYHGIWRGPNSFAGDSMFISQHTFERRLALIRSEHFNVISLESAVESLQRQVPMPRDAVVITIDDGWYSTFAGMLPALRHHQMHATIYCDTQHLLSRLPVPHVMARYLRAVHDAGEELSQDAQGAFASATDLSKDQSARYEALLAFAAELGVDASAYLDRRAFDYMREEELAEAAAQGFAIELHTHTHSLGTFAFADVAREISLNRETLSRILKLPPGHFRHFCYPSGRVADGVRNSLVQLGIASATTLQPGAARVGDDPLMLPRLVDGEHLSDLEFEAELCGVGDYLRQVRDAGARLLHRSTPGGHAADVRLNA
jgi:peptidoglycan/xylan/chitin deacetylase (PgdA/CDA1 family)